MNINLKSTTGEMLGLPNGLYKSFTNSSINLCSYLVSLLSVP